MEYTAIPPRAVGAPASRPINSVKVLKNDEGKIVMRTELVEERILDKQNLLQHRHNLEMEMIRAEENLERLKADIAEVTNVIEEFTKEEEAGKAKVSK